LSQTPLKRFSSLPNFAKLAIHLTMQSAMADTDSKFDRNVYGQPLVPCSFAPRTGYFRDGCCKTEANDHGRHVVCALMSAEFLRFSEARGNDLITPRPQYDFRGLKSGDRWCLCALRWKEALIEGLAPRVFLESTHIKALDFVTLAQLQAHSADG
jgi:uncharacterized protein